MYVCVCVSVCACFFINSIIFQLFLSQVLVDDLVVYRGLLSRHSSIHEGQTVLFSEHLAELSSNLTK